jgi:hypothetical protein
MAKRCAILLLWTMIGTNAYAESSCHYYRHDEIENSQVIHSRTEYTCKNGIPEPVRPVKIRDDFQPVGDGFNKIISTLFSLGLL